MPRDIKYLSDTESTEFFACQLSQAKPWPCGGSRSKTLAKLSPTSLSDLVGGGVGEKGQKDPISQSNWGNLKTACAVPVRMGYTRG